MVSMVVLLVSLDTFRRSFAIVFPGLLLTACSPSCALAGLRCRRTPSSQISFRQNNRPQRGHRASIRDDAQPPSADRLTIAARWSDSASTPDTGGGARRCDTGRGGAKQRCNLRFEIGGAPDLAASYNAARFRAPIVIPTRDLALNGRTCNSQCSTRCVGRSPIQFGVITSTSAARWAAALVRSFRVVP